MLRFRAIEPADADLFYRVENDETAWSGSDTVAPWSRHVLRQYAESYTGDPFADGQLRLVVEDSAEGKPVGILDFYELSRLHSRAWVGIYILPEYRGKGLARRILDMGASFARLRLNLGALGARVLESNTVSARLFGKAGYKHCGTLPAWHFADGQYNDIHLFILSLKSNENITR